MSAIIPLSRIRRLISITGPRREPATPAPTPAVGPLRSRSPYDGSNKPLPTLPPLPIVETPAPSRPNERRHHGVDNFSAPFQRRLDRAAAKASSPSRLVTPMGILQEFRKEGIDLRGQFLEQARVDDAQLDAHAVAAYNASLPKARAPLARPVRNVEKIMLNLVEWDESGSSAILSPTRSDTCQGSLPAASPTTNYSGASVRNLYGICERNYERMLAAWRRHVNDPHAPPPVFF